MEALEQLADVFSTATSSTTEICDIPNDSASTRVQRNAPVPRVPNLPSRMKNIPTPEPALAVEYPQETGNRIPSAPQISHHNFLTQDEFKTTLYNTQGRATQNLSISQDSMFQEVNTSNYRLKPSNLTVEEHRSLGGIISSRLYSGAFVGIIYELLVFS